MRCTSKDPILNTRKADTPKMITRVARCAKSNVRTSLLLALWFCDAGKELWGVDRVDTWPLVLADRGIIWVGKEEERNEPNNFFIGRFVA